MIIIEWEALIPVDIAAENELEQKWLGRYNSFGYTMSWPKSCIVVVWLLLTYYYPFGALST